VAAAAAALLLAAALPGCGGLSSIAGDTGPQAGEPGYVRGFLGLVAAEEPRAALLARDALSAGGTAVDAAVAAGFGLSVTLPSRAGLGGGGACLVFSPRRGETEAVLFLPGSRSAVPAGADRPAAVPMLARGLFALHTRGGRRPFEELIVPAEQLARLGTETSRALAEDLAAVAGPLMADPQARAVFAGPGGTPLAPGERLLQPDLGVTLAQLRVSGVGDLYQGALARRLEEASVPAGGALTVAELRASVPTVVPPVALRAGNDTVQFLPLPADGGLAAAASFRALQTSADAEAAAARGLSVARSWRDAGGEPAALLESSPPPSAWGPLPASTALTVVDREGGAVACAFTMNNLFGTGRIAPGTGVLLGAAPGVGAVQPPLLSAAIVTNPNLRAFRLAVAGSGQLAAPMAVAGPLARALSGTAPEAAIRAASPEPGRTQLISCPRYLPGSEAQCAVATDPRGAGAAIGAVDQ
jgi:gamma-glutamyltranspeptidase/glutathione hydrolase